MSYGSNKKLKTEHAGAKNGGGYWGTREEVKAASRKIRRSQSKKEVQQQIKGVK